MPKPTLMVLLLVDRTIIKYVGIFYNVLVKVESFIFPAYFIILVCEVDFEVSIILGSPLLVIGQALVDIETDQLKF